MQHWAGHCFAYGTTLIFDHREKQGRNIRVPEPFPHLIVDEGLERPAVLAEDVSVSRQWAGLFGMNPSIVASQRMAD